MKSKERIHTTYHLENQFIHAMFHVEQKVLSRCRPIYVGHKPVLYTLQSYTSIATVSQEGRIQDLFR